LTSEKAHATEVVLLWDGTRQGQFDKIVAALQDADIPNRAGSGATPDRGLPLPGIFGLFRQANNARRNMSWQVFVLESDFPRAEAILQKLLHRK
jgi:hypothetical protein